VDPLEDPSILQQARAQFSIDQPGTLEEKLEGLGGLLKLLAHRLMQQELGSQRQQQLLQTALSMTEACIDAATRPLVQRVLMPIRALNVTFVRPELLMESALALHTAVDSSTGLQRSEVDRKLYNRSFGDTGHKSTKPFQEEISRLTATALLRYLYEEVRACV
jgi:hypothetical protein